MGERKTCQNQQIINHEAYLDRQAKVIWQRSWLLALLHYGNTGDCTHV